MSEERWVKESPTPGQDPREIDREKTGRQALDEVAAQDGIEHPREPREGMGTSADASPGRDLRDLEDTDARDVPGYRDRS